MGETTLSTPINSIRSHGLLLRILERSAKGYNACESSNITACSPCACPSGAECLLLIPSRRVVCGFFFCQVIRKGVQYLCMFSISKKIKENCKGCGSDKKKHYAKGLCKSCYDGWRSQLGMDNSVVIRNPHCTSCGRRPVKRVARPAICASCLKSNSL